MLDTVAIVELRQAYIYREMLQSALRQMFADHQRIETLERTVAALRAENRRYVAMQMGEAE